MASSKLNKTLYSDITKLKLLDADNAPTRFQLTKSPFSDDGDTQELVANNEDEYTVVGKIFPQSSPYNQRSYLIEIKLTKTFPADPPTVRFLTPIYHPNVEEDGKFCNELLQKTAKWLPTTSLVEVVKTVVQHIDKPDIDYSLRAHVGKEYQDNREEFNRNALKNVLQHGLPL